MQQHVHPAEVECRRVVNCFQPLFTRNDDFGQNLAHFLRRIKLTCLFTRSSSELTNHIFVGIAQYVDVLRLFQPEVDAVQCDEYVANQPVFVVGRPA